jgi:Homeobox KN domain
MTSNFSKAKFGRGSRKSSSLPVDTVEYLKNWMMSPDHIAHPYPTEQEKALIMEDTGIELKQLTNWFVNNRKRYWKPRVEARVQHHPQTPAAISALTNVTEVASAPSLVAPISPETNTLAKGPSSSGFVHFDLPRTSSQASISGTDISKFLGRKDSLQSFNLVSEASSNASISGSEVEDGSEASTTEDYSIESLVKTDECTTSNPYLQTSGQMSSQASPAATPSKKRLFFSRLEQPARLTPRKKFQSSSIETWRDACQEASHVYCDSLPTLEEATRLFGYAN